MVVTTGAAPGLVALALAKLFAGSRTVWIDSIANTERLSLSGRLARPVADAWLTQWPHLARPGGPEHWGAVRVIFVTVGVELPFDRLVRAMDAFAAAHPGEEVLRPDRRRGLPARAHALAAPARARRLRRGGGRRPSSSSPMPASARCSPPASTASRSCCCPAAPALGEHRNDHQLDTAGWLGGRPGVFVAGRGGDLPAAIAAARGAAGAAPAVPRAAPPAFLARLRAFALG